MNWIFIKSQAKGFEEYGSVTARVRSNGQNRKFAIGYRIKESEWERVRDMKYTPGNMLTSANMRYVQFTGLLSRIKVAIEDNIDEPQLIPAIIRSVKSATLIGEGLSIPDLAINGKMLLSKFLEQYRNDLASGKRLKRKKSIPVSKGHVDNVSCTLNTLKRFEKSGHPKVTLDKVNMTFQRSFVLYMRNRGLKPNSVYSRMNIIRMAMEAAYTDKLTRAEDFRNPEFVPTPEETDSVWLTPDMIEQLRTMDLSTTEAVEHLYQKAKFSRRRLARLPSPNWRLIQYLNYSRDIFVAGCLTGQRFSDYTRLCQEMIVTLNQSQFLSLRQVKTGTKVFIPLDTRVSEILTRYNGRLPYVSKLTYGKHIKLLAELLGWTYTPEFDMPSSTKCHARFCDMVTTHTCRRSFATNAYAAGIPLSSIMAVTGHTSEKNLRRYLKLQAENKAIIAAKDFKGFLHMKGEERHRSFCSTQMSCEVS